MASVWVMGDMLETMIDDLRQLVEAESPSSDPQLLARSAEIVADLIERHLGTRPTLIDEGVGPHVHWTGGGDPKVLILGHHDTVFPAGTLVQRPFNVENGRATGPGVFDMKAGIVQAIHAVASINDRSGVEILLSCDEEVGSTTSRSLLEERAVACGTVLVLEPSGEGGALKTGRKGTGTFEVVIGGRAAHAGLEPHRGV
ncbi:MAG TPA: glutamate carboxypeptidase, partial [Acidimicrobiaceae bacterium]|nr:glutamate carboxypeptidase [Acidimicrobiaceae bacterium]